MTTAGDNAWKPPFKIVPNRLSEEQVNAFLDELTMLTRKYQVMLHSDFPEQTFAMVPTDHKEVNSGRYTMDASVDYYFWDFDGESRKKLLHEGAVGVVWDSSADLDNLVDF